jgi:hypothetical protein
MVTTTDYLQIPGGESRGKESTWQAGAATGGSLFINAGCTTLFTDAGTSGARLATKRQGRPEL